MGMMVSPFLHVTWFSLLIFECTYTGLEATVTDACENDDTPFDDLLILNSSENISLIPTNTSNFQCLLYPTLEVNCSWSFQSIGMEAKITTNISICDGGKTMQTQESKASVGSHSSHIQKTLTHLILYFNIILHDQWAIYYYKYNNEALEVLSPPPNVRGLFEGNDLLVTWDKPSCIIYCSNHCLEYELHIRDQENPKYVEGQMFYTEPNVDLTQIYTVIIRTRIIESCTGSNHWSDWSLPVTIQAKQSLYQLNAEVIIAISLGIPMIVLALLLVVCRRFSTRLFPPIPSPPPRYLHVLQNNDQFVSPDLALNPEEEITIVFYSENEKAHKSL